MREAIRDKGRLEHILEAIQNLFEFTENLSFEEYQNNKILKFAVVKNLEIIGEAAYKLTFEFKSVHTEVDWRDVIGLRHVLVHGYYQISDEMVWDVIQHDLEPLKEAVERILAKIDESGIRNSAP